MRKNILLLGTLLLVLVSCTPKEIKDVPKGTSLEQLEKDFGKADDKTEAFGLSYLIYGENLVVIKDNKVDTIVSANELKKSIEEMNKGLEDLEKTLKDEGMIK